MSTKNFFNKYQKYLNNTESTVSARNQLLETCLMLLKDEHAPRQHLDKMFIDILIDSSKSAGFDPDKAATAFCYIEEYVELLYRYPWKREYWIIKNHCGFYRTMINPWVKRAEEIFKKIGYHIVNGNCLQLQNEPNSALLVGIGTQCLFASAECSLLSEACRLADSTNYMPNLMLHLDSGGTSKDIVAKLRTHNERMFGDPTKDLFISDLPLNYGYIDMQQNSRLLKQSPNSQQNIGHTYGPGRHPLAAVTDIHLTQRTYTEEQQAAFDSYRRPLGQKQTPHFQPTPNRTEPFRGMSAAVASPLSAPVPILAADSSNCDLDSAYGDSTYGDSLHEYPSENQPSNFNILSLSARRPREPTEHALEKSAEDEDISSERTLTPTESTCKSETISRLAANLSSLPLSSSSSSSSSPSGWTCKVCSYNNQTDTFFCRMCSQTNSGDTPSPPSQFLQHRNSERICEKCTLKNKVTAHDCKQPYWK